MGRHGKASSMRYRRLGSSELEVSEISLGSWLTYGGGVGNKQAEACVAKAFEVGINFIDTANVYSRGGAEEFLGGVLANRPRADYVDLYQCHRYDDDTPLEETMEALTEVVRLGKARYLGFSEWPADRIQAAVDLPDVEKF